MEAPAAARPAPSPSAAAAAKHRASSCGLPRSSARRGSACGRCRKGREGAGGSAALQHARCGHAPREVILHSARQQALEGPETLQLPKYKHTCIQTQTSSDLPRPRKHPGPAVPPPQPAPPAPPPPRPAGRGAAPAHAAGGPAATPPPDRSAPGWRRRGSGSGLSGRQESSTEGQRCDRSSPNMPACLLSANLHPPIQAPTQLPKRPYTSRHGRPLAFPPFPSSTSTHPSIPTCTCTHLHMRRLLLQRMREGGLQGGGVISRGVARQASHSSLQRSHGACQQGTGWLAATKAKFRAGRAPESTADGQLLCTGQWHAALGTGKFGKRQSS